MALKSKTMQSQGGLIIGTVWNVINFLRERQITVKLSFLFLIYILLLYKTVTLSYIDDAPLLMSYSVLVGVYLISRFLFAYFYDPDVEVDRNYTPTVTFVTPAKDEEENIGHTLSAMLQSDYPRDKMEIIAINDGSKDRTLKEMMAVKRKAEALGIRMQVIDWVKNRGKRHGMAEGVKRASGEIIIFIDSDSFVVPSTARELVKYFTNSQIGAVSGHCDVYNRDTNILTKMQAVRFFVAFRAYKAAEALFGVVTCCSGCCAAYRRDYIMGFLDKWLNQRFWGRECTYGDDRSLTNYLLEQNYEAVYSPSAYSQTVVPDTWRKFLKQQLRWKKSWTRETTLAMFFMWRKNFVAFVCFALGFILPILAPFVVVRAFVWLPTTEGVMPFVYTAGLIFMSIIYGLFYRLYRKDNLWIYGMVFTWFYSLILIWQLPYAILTLRDSRWGTR